MKLEDIKHVGRVITFCVTLAGINPVYISPGVQLWGAFLLLLCRGPLGSRHTGGADSRARPDPRCVFPRVCSQSLMNNLSRSNAGASGLLRWNGEEESSLETVNQPNSLVSIWRRRRVRLGVVALQQNQVVRLTNDSIHKKKVRNNNVQHFRQQIFFHKEIPNTNKMTCGEHSCLYWGIRTQHYWYYVALVFVSDVNFIT